ncbi:MAG TPA: putative O-glycosylation ligase, exosortase A system-associated, partial [Candidatus Eisenbacteria bacterium]|nr:putative O-glycosylation ligase, exosortase A system-associated [Candidatus Eisenbacteria bacterium]
MRDYILLAIILAGVPFALTRPFIGVLYWSWISYMNPHRLTWGVAYNFPAAMVIGGATLLGLLFTKDRTKLPLERETMLLITLLILYVVTTSFALFPAAAWARFDQIAKILLMTFVTMMLITNRDRLRTFLLVIALSVGFFGAKGGIFSIRSGGADRIYGPPGSFLEDNNDLALAIVMVLPLLFYLARDERRTWVKWGLRATGLLSILAVLFTYSRGGFVGLAAISGWGLLKSKKKALGIIVLVIALIGGSFFLPEQWLNRMQTIGDTSDMSALGRINAWMFAYNLATTRVFGGGFDTFSPTLFLRYAPDPTDFHAAHSIYFEMLGEQGFPGLLLFLTILASAFLSLQGLGRRYRKWPGLQWAASYADMLQISLVG